MFQHTAARRRLVAGLAAVVAKLFVSTHSRPKAAGAGIYRQDPRNRKSFNTQPPEGGWQVFQVPADMDGRFNTQPPEGGWHYRGMPDGFYPRFNTQPPEGGWNNSLNLTYSKQLFQHTAARRRLEAMY